MYRYRNGVGPLLQEGTIHEKGFGAIASENDSTTA